MSVHAFRLASASAAIYAAIATRPSPMSVIFTSSSKASSADMPGRAPLNKSAIHAALRCLSGCDNVNVLDKLRCLASICVAKKSLRARLPNLGCVDVRKLCATTIELYSEFAGRKSHNQLFLACSDSSGHEPDWTRACQITVRLYCCWHPKVSPRYPSACHFAPCSCAFSARP